MLYFLSRSIFEILMRILFKLSFYGREKVPDAPYIVVSNHESLLDPPFVAVACKKDPVDFMAKAELFDKPILGAWTSRVRCIKVKRGKNSVASLKEALKRVSMGHVIGVFPEGTRSVTGELQEAKRGIGFLVARANVPVVPIYVEGTGEAFPKGKPVKRGTRINLYVGNTVYPKDLPIKGESGKHDYEGISNVLMEHIARAKSDNV